MVYPLSEIFDRLTIETRKAQYGAKNYELRQNYVKAIAEKCGLFMANVIAATIELAIANGDIANLEWAIRMNKELSPSEMGRRAVAIRKLNDSRITAKVQLAGYLGEVLDPKRYDHKERFTSILQPLGKKRAKTPSVK